MQWTGKFKCGSGDCDAVPCRIPCERTLILDPINVHAILMVIAIESSDLIALAFQQSRWHLVDHRACALIADLITANVPH